MTRAPEFVQAEVVGQEELGHGYYIIRILAPCVVGKSLPGQFVMLKSLHQPEPLLPRPFSYAALDYDGGTFDLLYRVVGKGTASMARWTKGEPVTVLGPLGKPWPLPGRVAGRAVRTAVVGRGLGIAPLIGLAQALKEQGHRVDAYLSSRRRELVPGRPQLEPFVDRLFVACDDDPATPALVTDFLEQALEQGETPPAIAYVCGANRLIRAVAELGTRYGFPGYASLEQHMACGYGACKGCVVPLAPGNPGDGRDFVYERVCLEGPIFPVERVLAAQGVIP